MAENMSAPVRPNSTTAVSAFGSAVHNHTDGNTSLSVEDFLSQVLGPQQLEGPLLIPITIFYIAIFLSGMVGNLSVCIVIGKNKSLHSAMNYYLICLAISDLVIIVLGLPHELSIYWHQYPFPFGETFCKLRSFLSEMFSYTSVLTIVSFSLERYQAICHPLSSLPLSDRTRVATVFLCCTGVAAVFSLPHLIFTKINYLDFPWQSGIMVEESAFCAMLDNNIYPQWLPIHEISFLLFFLVPIILLTILYIRIGVAISRSARSNLRRSFHRSSRGTPLDNRKQIIRMLVAVVIIFFISWAPFHLQRLGYVYFKESIYFRTVNEYLFYLSGCLYFLSSTLNPILYNVMNVKYREAFKSTFCRRKSGNQTTDARLWISNQTSGSFLNRDTSGGENPMSIRMKLLKKEHKDVRGIVSIAEDRCEDSQEAGDNLLQSGQDSQSPSFKSLQ